MKKYIVSMFVCIFVLGMAMVTIAQAVTVHMKDGSIISGDILGMDQSTVQLKTSYGTVKINNDQIENIDYGNAPQQNNQPSQQDQNQQDLSQQPNAGTDISSSEFYDSLSPYGNWVNVPQYGYVWYPGAVGTDWTPYVNGYWVLTDAGWTWVSYEPWGWATYHYGAWQYTDIYGWVWIPGTVWRPAWVIWYRGPGYIGWAPRPHIYPVPIPPGHCVFVRSNAFLDVHIGSVIVPRAMNGVILRQSNQIRVVGTFGGGTIYRGPSTGYVGRVTGRGVQKFNIVTGRGAGTNRISGRTYYVHRANFARGRGKSR